MTIIAKAPKKVPRKTLPKSIADTPTKAPRKAVGEKSKIPVHRTSDAVRGIPIELVDKAARLFSAKGYDNTSMRDIASAFGILHGSLYHHIGSKEELFITVYAMGVEHFMQDVQRAIAPLTDPWERLEAASVAHLEALLTRDSPAAAVLADWSTNYSDTMRSALIRERDRYEKMFVELTDAVDLSSGIKRRYFRLGLLGALNGALNWYQPGRDSPATVARHLFSLFNHLSR
jgi:AcrR family transcriptional regulator